MAFRFLLDSWIGAQLILLHEASRFETAGSDKTLSGYTYRCWLLIADSRERLNEGHAGSVLVNNKVEPISSRKGAAISPPLLVSMVGAK